MFPVKHAYTFKYIGFIGKSKCTHGHERIIHCRHEDVRNRVIRERFRPEVRRKKLDRRNCSDGLITLSADSQCCESMFQII